MKQMPGRKHSLKLIIASILLMLVSSCNIYRYVPEKDFLFTGSRISFDSKNKNASEIKSTLLSRMWPLPNKKIALIPLQLMSYSISKPTEKKFINYFLHEKFGEAPVLLSQANPEIGRVHV